MRVFHLAMLANTGGGSIPSSLPAVFALDETVTPVTASASIFFEIDGTITTVGSGPNNGGNWFNPTTSGIGNSYWVKIVVTSGTVSGMTSGTWYQLSSSRSITKTRVTVGTNAASGTYFISTAGSDGTIVGDADGGTWDLTATQDA